MAEAFLVLGDGDSFHDQRTGKALPKEANAPDTSGADPEPEVMFESSISRASDKKTRFRLPVASLF